MLAIVCTKTTKLCLWIFK